MRYERSKWLWIANIIMVRTGSSHKKYGGFAPGYMLFLLLVLEKMRVPGAADKENR